MASQDDMDKINARAADREAQAEVVILSNTAANAGVALLPIGTSVIAFIAANCSMVVALGYIYGFTTTKEQAGALIKRVLFALGATWGIGLIAMKLGFEVAKVMGIVTFGASTVVACSVDAIMSGSLSYALGYTALTYFKNGCRFDEAEMRRIFMARMQEGRSKVQEASKNGFKPG